MSRILGGLGKRACGRVRVGAPDPSLTGTGGLIAVTELLDRLDVIGLLDVAVGPIKQRDRGFGAGELLVGMASAQLAGQDFLVGLDRVRADTAGQALSPVPGLASTTATGLARRFTGEQWRAVESGVAAVTERMLTLLPPERAEALTSGPVTMDMVASGADEPDRALPGGPRVLPAPALLDERRRRCRQRGSKDAGLRLPEYAPGARRLVHLLPPGRWPPLPDLPVALRAQRPASCATAGLESLAVLRERHPRSREVGTPVFLASPGPESCSPLFASGDASVQLDIRETRQGSLRECDAQAQGPVDIPDPGHAGSACPSATAA